MRLTFSVVHLRSRACLYLTGLTLMGCGNLLGLRDDYRLAEVQEQTGGAVPEGTGGHSSELAVSGGGGGTTASGYAASGGSAQTSGGAVACSNHALEFAGNGEALRFADHPDWDGHLRLTVEAWVQPAAAAVDGEVHIVSHHNHGDERGFVLLLMHGSPVFRVYGDGRNEEANGQGSPPLEPLRWYHIAGVYDGDAGVVSVFLDGNRLARNQGAPDFLANCTNALVIGSNPQIDTFHFSGMIDEVRLSASARYTQSFTRPNGPFSKDSTTLALWHFDESEGDTVFDETMAHDGQISAAPLAPLRRSVDCISNHP